MHQEKNPIFKKFEYNLTIIASLSSIASIVLLIFNSHTTGVIALLLLLIFLILIYIRFFLALKKLLFISFPDGFIKLSTEVIYSTIDGKFITYENYKFLQCKQPILNEFSHNFKWSGSKTPIIKSNFQIVSGDIIKRDKDNFDSIMLKFTDPVFFNQVFVVHTKMELDDSDNRSKPYIETKIDTPLKLLSVRVELKHKDISYIEKAQLRRKKINATLNAEYEDLDYISFDQNSKSYHLTLCNPEPGYYYRLDWTK